MKLIIDIPDTSTTPDDMIVYQVPDGADLSSVIDPTTGKNVLFSLYPWLREDLYLSLSLIKGLKC